MKGRIHSIETFGTVDGPGIRLVVFFQGCPMRCKYCHNPDTWDYMGGKEMSVDDIIKLYEKNSAFYRNGGITVTGGEPLVQLEFLTELFKEAKMRGIHTCLDTSGIMYHEKKEEEYHTLFSVTDLVLLDIKHSDPIGHEELTGRKKEAVLQFQKALEKEGIPIVIRHVVVPGITDSKEELEKLGQEIAHFRNLKGLDVLPYHSMGISKYEELGMEYPLFGVEDMDKSRIKECREIILDAFRKERLKCNL